MTPETKELIRKASQNLKIKDILLFESRFDRPERNIEKQGKQARQEHKREVRFFTNEDAEEGAAETSPAVLQVLVSLGTRLMPNESREDVQAYFQIEAEFLVSYEMQGTIDQECMRAFSDNNAVHNVWPFWRQHVFDIVSRARLPHLEIPLYSGLMA